MYQQQYKMAVHVTPESENDPEWPSKRSGLMPVNG